MTEVFVEDIHTPEMVADETLFCIGDRLSMVTLAGFMRLCVIKSPYVFGGDVTLDDVNAACKALGSPVNAAFDDDLRTELAAVNRAFEIIETDKRNGQKSVIPPFGPEWLADFMAAVADAMPSITPKKMLKETPMVLLVHLAAASHRKNGGVTRRPTNTEAAFQILNELEEKADNET